MDDKKVHEVQIMQYAKSAVKTIDIRFEWTVSRKVIESTCKENVKISPRYDVQLDKERTSWFFRLYRTKADNGEKFTQLSLFLAKDSGVVSGDKKVEGTFSFVSDEGKLINVTPLSEEKVLNFTTNGWGFRNFCELSELEKYYVNDKITLIFDSIFIIDTDESIPNDRNTNSGVKRKYDNMESDVKFLADMKSLYGYDSLSDLVIFCGDQKFLCHKIVLASRSDLFKKLFENKENPIGGEHEVTETSPDLMKLIIDFMYTGEIPKNIDSVAEELFLQAIKYKLHPLVKACEIGILNQITVSNALELLIMIDQNKTSTSAKDDVIKYITINSKEIIDTDQFKTFAKEQPELMIDIFRDLSDRLNREVRPTMKTEESE